MGKNGKYAQDHIDYMEEALAQARLALDMGEFPVGCVLVDDGRVIARGHRRNSRGQGRNELDHAEVATLRELLGRRPDYDTSRVSLYATMEPCLMCYSTALLSGIRNFIWAYEDVMGGGMGLPLGRLPSLYAGMQVYRRGGVLRAEALELFVQFFREHEYWRDSPLSRYTLDQEHAKDA